MKSLKEQIKKLIKEELSLFEAAATNYESLGYEKGLKDLDQDTWGDIVSSLSSEPNKPRNNPEAISYARGYLRAMREHIDAVKIEQEKFIERLYQQMNDVAETFDATIQRSSKKSFD